MTKEFEEIKEKYEKYIKDNNLRGFRVAVSKERGYGTPELWLIKKLPKTIIVNEENDENFISKMDSVVEYAAFDEAAVRIDVKTLTIAINVLGVMHPNGGGPIEIEGSDKKWQTCCVGTMFDEVIDFDSMKQVFSLPERGAYTLRRQSAPTEEDDDGNEIAYFDRDTIEVDAVVWSSIDINHDAESDSKPIWRS